MPSTRCASVAASWAVETEAQREALKACGCDYLQGFLTGKPVDAFEKLPAEERQKIEHDVGELQEQLDRVIQHLPRWRRDMVCRRSPAFANLSWSAA